MKSNQLPMYITYMENYMTDISNTNLGSILKDNLGDM